MGLKNNYLQCSIFENIDKKWGEKPKIMIFLQKIIFWYCVDAASLGWWNLMKISLCLIPAQVNLLTKHNNNPQDFFVCYF